MAAAVHTPSQFVSHPMPLHLAAIGTARRGVVIAELT